MQFIHIFIFSFLFYHTRGYHLSYQDLLCVLSIFNTTRISISLHLLPTILPIHTHTITTNLSTLSILILILANHAHCAPTWQVWKK